MIGRFFALRTKQCPKDYFKDNDLYHGVVKWCADCPDSCPLFIKEQITKDGYIAGRNNPVNHPEDFIDCYSEFFPLDEYVLEFDNKKGYFFTKEPKHWNDFVKLIKDIIFL